MRGWIEIEASLLAFLLACGPGLGVARAAEPPATAADLPRLKPLEPDQALAAFRVKPGFQIELAAAEPLVVDPVAMAFDEEGRLFVVEMRDYSERRDEKLGRIRRLEDTNGDGRFDQSKVFAQDLPWPTAVICWKGGVFVGATPDILYLKDQDGDGIADESKVVFTGFARGSGRLNVQALLNSFTWGLDNRIHGATSLSGAAVVAAGTNASRATPLELRGRDFSFDPRTLEIRAESGGGQHGLAFDDAGRKFVCSNSHHIQQVMYEDIRAGRGRGVLPPPLADIAADGPAAEVFRISPDEPWRIVRTRWRVAGLVSGPVEGGGRVSGYFTAATGVTIYRGNAWPAEYRGDVLIGDAGSNLIHHKKLEPDGVARKAVRPADEAGVEFIASTDNWFRPVQFANAPDGCLYVADMYRETIEHPWSLPESIKQHLDLNSGNDRGRIYRIAPEGFKRPPGPRLGAASTEVLVKTLEHPNGWHRDTAARLLLERQDPDAPRLIMRLFKSSRLPLARLRALYLLDGMGSAWSGTLRAALDDSDPRLRWHAVRLCDGFFMRQASFTAAVEKKLLSMAGDPDPTVRQQLAFSLGASSNTQRLPAERVAALNRILAASAGDPWIEPAVLSGVGSQAADLLKEMLATRGGPWRDSPGAWNRAALRLTMLTGASGGLEKAGWLIDSLAERRLPDEVSDFEWLLALDDGLKQAGRSLEEADSQNRLGQVWDRAASAAADRSQPAAVRARAASLAGRAPNFKHHAALLSLLDAAEPGEVRDTAFAALVQSSKRDRVRMGPLLERWPTMAPAFRRQLVSALLAWEDGTILLLEALEAGGIQAGDLSTSETVSLRGHRNGALRERALKVLGEGTAPEETARALRPALELAGNRAAGERIFQARCAPCHRLGSVGTERSLGPDLATVKNAGKEKIWASIVDPNREVPPAMVSYTIETKDGESLSGLIVSESATGLTLRQAGGSDTALARSQVVSMRSDGKSVMPEGLAEGLSAQDLADLLEFITR